MPCGFVMVTPSAPEISSMAGDSPIGVHVTITMVGADVYPAPPSSMVSAVTMPAATVAEICAGVVAPPPTATTSGATA